MPLAARHRLDPHPALTPLAGLHVAPVHDAARLAALQGREPVELERRFEQRHRAYLATLDGEPAAWGWVATRMARIGELDASFPIPTGNRYLWNFVTLPAHRGRGVYPRLLDAIVRAESAEAERFWIAYAPENHASAAGIARAGFTTLATLSFDASGRPAVGEREPGGAAAAARLLGLPVAARVAPCWRCARFGKGGSCRADTCRCDYQRREEGCVASPETPGIRTSAPPPA